MYLYKIEFNLSVISHNMKKCIGQNFYIGASQEKKERKKNVHFKFICLKAVFVIFNLKGSLAVA